MYRWLKYIWNALLQTLLRALIETNLSPSCPHIFQPEMDIKELSESLLITSVMVKKLVATHCFLKESIIPCI